MSYWLPARSLVTHEGQDRKEDAGCEQHLCKRGQERLVDILRPGWVNSYVPSTAGKVINARG